MRTRYVDRLVEPLTLLPSQLPTGGGAGGSPEVRLIVAILDDAVHSILQYAGTVGSRESREFLEARRWLLDDDRDWPFAFANVCEVLGLNADAVRERLFPEHTRRADHPFDVERPVNRQGTRHATGLGAAAVLPPAADGSLAPYAPAPLGEERVRGGVGAIMLPEVERRPVLVGE